MISNELRNTFQQVYSILNKHSVDCLLVGGSAVTFYGYQRISGISLFKPEVKTDLDFWYNPTVGNFTSILKALHELGVDISDLEQIIFDPQKTFLKIPFEKFHLDFLPQMQGLPSYSACKKNAKKEFIDGNEIFIIGLNDLIINKNAIGRDIDKGDLDYLKNLSQ